MTLPFQDWPSTLSTTRLGRKLWGSTRPSPTSLKTSSIGRFVPVVSLSRRLILYQIWPDFGPTGLKKYEYLSIAPSAAPIPVPGTKMTIEAFPVYHSYPYLSTAFLISDADSHLLYFGDMGPDAVENKKVVPPNQIDLVKTVWKRVWSSRVAT